MDWRVRVAIAAAAVVVCPELAAAAGNVEASVKGGNLVLTGDDASNELELDQDMLGAGELRVTPGVGTTLNGAAGPAVFPGVAKGSPRTSATATTR